MRIAWSIGLLPPFLNGGCHLMVSYRGWVKDRFISDRFVFHCAYYESNPIIDILEYVFPGKNVQYSLDKWGDIIIEKVFNSED